MKNIYANVRGTCDFDAARSIAFCKLNAKSREIFKAFGYEEIILPILEDKGLFARGVGSSTDIVERQMFKIENKEIVLRPEGTAQVVRYYLQNSLYRKSDFYKFSYLGPMFRGERPQKGRLRQFNHIGAEAIGSTNIYLDAEVIILALNILDSFGILDKNLVLNTVGCAEDKKKFANYLKDILGSKKGELCDDCARRLGNNPLRILDCKNRQCKRVVNSLNLTQNHLCPSCKKQFIDLLSILDESGINYVTNPLLVRGLDYYTNTVFEINSKSLGSQDAIGAGGRYNNLIESLGGPSVPAIGFALGLERILIALGEKEKEHALDVFIAISEPELLDESFKMLREFRKENLSCVCDYLGKSLKGQLRVAQKKNATFSVILNKKELKAGFVFLRDMDKSTQTEVRVDDLIQTLKLSLNR